ncbi:extensin-like [Arachis ipaensis]|uniref:extensin-like n=1 Tax=Arachis ipaensis TaxID=130454 RepID=UPI000A2B11EC|nr:extensin-like [Arachis ipaensis]
MENNSGYFFMAFGQVGKVRSKDREVYVEQPPGFENKEHSNHVLDRTFTPSPSPPTTPHRCDPMARTKNTPRFPASAKPTPPPKATPSKPGSSKPSSAKPGSSKGKRQATEEPIPEPSQPKSRPNVNSPNGIKGIQQRILG